MNFHPHIHVILLGGGLTSKRQWKDKGENFFPRVRINNCRFINNCEVTNSTLSNDYASGSAINLATGKVYVDNTLFSGNVSYNRGMIHAASAGVQAGTCLFMNNCRFTGNSLAADQYGIVIRSLNVNTKVALNGCSFGKNSPNSKGDAPVCISSPCVFVNNTVIEDASNPYKSNVGIYRMASITDVEAVLANNLIMDENNVEDSFYGQQELMEISSSSSHSQTSAALNAIWCSVV